MPVPVFAVGEVLTAADMNKIGLYLVKTQVVGTTVATVAVTNAFSSDFANYRITWTGGVLSAAANVRMVMGSTATQYYQQTIYAAYNSVGGPVSNFPDDNAVRWNIVGSGTTTFAVVGLNLYNPNAAARTILEGTFVSPTLSGITNGYLNNNTSYTGFTFSLSTGTMTGGTIRVYGYRN